MESACFCHDESDNFDGMEILSNKKIDEKNNNNKIIEKDAFQKKCIAICLYPRRVFIKVRKFVK